MYDIVIPSLYEVDGDYLELCVKSLRDSGFGGRIIVVTNGSKSQPNLSYIKGISVHLHTSDQGQCGAVNRGAQLVDTEYMMVSNSDMYYAPGWDKYISQQDDWEAIRKLNFLVFSPNLIEPVNNAGSAPPFLKFDGGLAIEEFNKEALDKFVVEQTNVGKEKPYFSSKFQETGFNLPFFIKKDLWDFLGGYDVGFDPWGSNSDTDLQTRINLAGVTPMRLRDVLVYHFSNKTPTFAPENDAFRMHNFDYFKQKFGFDRDSVEGCDVWYNKNILPEDKSIIKYHQEKYNARTKGNE